MRCFDRPSWLKRPPELRVLSGGSHGAVSHVCVAMSQSPLRLAARVPAHAMATNVVGSPLQGKRRRVTRSTWSKRSSRISAAWGARPPLATTTASCSSARPDPGLGRLPRRRARRDGDPGSLPGPRGDCADAREELPLAITRRRRGRRLRAVDAAGPVDAQTASIALWKSLRDSHSLHRPSSRSARRTEDHARACARDRRQTILALPTCGGRLSNVPQWPHLNVR
jgi:hypothetical protein